MKYLISFVFLVFLVCSFSSINASQKEVTEPSSIPIEEFLAGKTLIYEGVCDLSIKSKGGRMFPVNCKIYSQTNSGDIALFFLDGVPIVVKERNGRNVWININKDKVEGSDLLF